MVVNNTIISDARVRKTGRTLSERRHANKDDIIFIGFGKLSVTSVENIPLKLVDLLVLRYGHMLLKHTKSYLKHHYLISAIFGLFVVALILDLSIANFDAVLDLSAPFLICLTVIGIAGLILRAFLFKLLYQLKGYLSTFIVRFGYYWLAKAFASQIKETGAHIIHAHDIVALLAAVLVKRQNDRIIIIWDAHELYTDVTYKHPHSCAYIDKIIRQSAPFITAMTTISTNFAKIYASRYPALPPAKVIMNATRHTTPAPKTKTQNKLRAHAHIAQDQKILLFQGALAHGRGLPLMLEAAAQLPKDWSIVFMGQGSFVHQVKSMAVKLNQNRESTRPAIRHIGPVPYEELIEWTRDATLGALLYENNSLNHTYCTPNKLWEYPNANVPILAIDLQEVSAIIKRYDIGIILPQDCTSQALIEALLSLNETRLLQMKDNCTSFNKAENWEKYEPTLLEIYEKITHENR